MILFFAFGSIIVAFVMLCTSTMVSVFSFSIFSLFSAVLYLILNALDVAITEVAVGSAISTIFFILTIRCVENNIVNKVYQSREYKISRALKKMSISKSIALFSVALGVILIGITDAFIDIGRLENVNFFSSDYYLANSYRETGVGNIVTSVLASYRGFDTLIENLVIMTAAIGVMFILQMKDIAPEPNNNGKNS